MPLAQTLRLLALVAWAADVSTDVPIPAVLTQGLHGQAVAVDQALSAPNPTADTIAAGLATTMFAPAPTAQATQTQAYSGLALARALGDRSFRASLLRSASPDEAAELQNVFARADRVPAAAEAVLSLQSRFGHALAKAGIGDVDAAFAGLNRAFDLSEISGNHAGGTGPGVLAPTGPDKPDLAPLQRASRRTTEHGDLVLGGLAVPPEPDAANGRSAVILDVDSTEVGPELHGLAGELERAYAAAKARVSSIVREETGVPLAAVRAVGKLGKQQFQDCARYATTACLTAMGFDTSVETANAAADAVLKRAVSRLDERRPLPGDDNERRLLAQYVVFLRRNASQIGVNSKLVGMHRAATIAMIQELGFEAEDLNVNPRTGRPIDGESELSAALIDKRQADRFRRMSASLVRRVEATLAEGHPVYVAIDTGLGGHAVAILRTGLDEAGQRIFTAYDSSQGRLIHFTQDELLPYEAFRLRRPRKKRLEHSL